MYRRYIIVCVVCFLLIGAYFMFFDKDEHENDYEEYYTKLVERDEFADYLNDVNLNIEEVFDENFKYSYIIVFDGVNEIKEDVKILVLEENWSEEEIEYFPSFGIIANFGYSLVKEGNENEENKLIKGISLSISNVDKIENFIIYFSSNGVEEFVKIPVNLS